MRNLTIAAALAVSLTGLAGSAQAQSWGQDKYGWQNRGYGWNGGGQDCSPRRAYALEARLDREWRQGNIDPRTARRIKDQIDKLEAKQDHECREGDWREVREIADRYDRIEQWIDRESQSYRYRRGGYGWNGDGYRRW